MATVSKFNIGGIDYDVKDSTARSSINGLGTPMATRADAMSQIPSNSDLNDYTTPGNYRVASTSIATSLSHRASNTAGRLIVMQLATGDNYMQVYIDNGGKILVRQKDSNGWTAWYEMSKMADINALGKPVSTDSSAMTQIPADSDMNDYTTVGNYRIASTAIATTIANRASNAAGRLIVSQLATSSNCMQVYIDNNARIFTRQKGAGDWSAWVELSNSTQIASINEQAERSAIAENGVFNAVKMIVRNGTYDIAIANAPVNLKFKNYIGNTQNIHPKVLYIPTLFGGHAYWMAYTPYPNGRDIYENPCIAYSDNGIDWTNIDGNPLDDPDGDGYNSDTHLVYNNGTMECWYRHVSSGATRYETIYRQTSTDGVNWSEKQTVFSSSTAGATHYLSPAVIFDGTKYQIWVVDGATITYYEAYPNSISSWTKVRTYSLTFTDRGDSANPWHLDVINDNGTYVMLVMTQVSASPKNKWSLFICTSEDNVTYTTPEIVVQGTNNWDKYMYRSSIVKADNIYRIYYSGLTESNVYGMGISESYSLDEFYGRYTP